MQLKLWLFLGEAVREWEATFPKELWRKFCRLTNWHGSLDQRPKYFGRLMMELIYQYLEPNVADWLRKNNPKPQKGQNHHQWLNSQYGLKKLTEHIWKMVGVAKACCTMRELRMKMAEVYGRQSVQKYLFLPPPNVVVAKPMRFPQRESPGYETASHQTPLNME